MIVGSELAIDKAQIERSANRRAAILAKGSLMGYRFIRLKLNNIRKRKVSGIDVLSATEFTNAEMGGIRDYHLELRGGDVDFEYRPEFGMYIYDMVDTERNRQFLATHFEYNFWEIVEKSIYDDINNRYQRIKAELLNKPVTPEQKSEAQKFWDEVRENEERMRRAARGEEIQPAPAATPQFPTDTPPDTRQVNVALMAKPQVGKKGWPKGKPRPKAKKLMNIETREQVREKLNQEKGTDIPTLSEPPQPKIPQFVPTVPVPVGVGVNAP